MSLYLGLMSGTSMDGIDVAIIDSEKNQLINGATYNYEDEVYSLLEHVLKNEMVTVAEICQLNVLIGRNFAKSALRLIEQSQLAPSDIRAIGSHGQTICHAPLAKIPYTLQLGCAHTIAAITGITVVADFRARDLVHGGQGAPLAPLYHRELFTNRKENIGVVNIGGIANLTVLVQGKPARGWDTGPGNCLMDAWIAKHLHKKFDVDGAWAAQGKILGQLLQYNLCDPFIQSSVPKSIGKEYFSLTWLEQQLTEDYQPEDVQRTLLEFTAQTIVNNVNLVTPKLQKLYICGGGVHNKLLLNRLADLLPECHVESIASLGVSPDYLEAMLFAWLAAQTMSRKLIDLSSITGSNQLMVLGAIFPAGAVNKR
ncbi:MAG: anhydro-N-acetylmuramic acid kinase [Legionella sp. 40-6]|nr:anhydro-N-acetylmuramic acid kinase [Legionella sp.]OJY13126.1 MAG: anhydro-N-acetylmuramic acid kinase [Legionella sp. 40-6]